MQQIALVTTEEDNSKIKVFDITTGQLISIFKQCSCKPHSLCLLGKDHFAVAQAKTAHIQFYTWYRETAFSRSYLPEKLTAVAASPDGTVFAGGGHSGTLYLWNTSTGQLLRSFSAHYRPIVKLQFTDKGSFLVSAGEDTVVQVWTLMDILDLASAQENSFAISSTFKSWSPHTQPITDLIVGSNEVNTLIVTSSMDRTVSICSLSSDSVLCKIPFESEVTCCAFDALEHYLFVGTKSGKQFSVELNSSDNPQIVYFNQQQINGAVTCQSLSVDGTKLVSGFADGRVVVWDIMTQQMQRELVKGGQNEGIPTNVQVLYRPPLLANSGVRDSNLAKGNKSKMKFQLLKYPNRQYDDPSIVLEQRDDLQEQVSEDVLNYLDCGGSDWDFDFNTGSNQLKQSGDKVLNEVVNVFKEISIPYMQQLRDELDNGNRMDL